MQEDTAFFVRDRMLSPEPPPAGERGAVKWLRENLFSGWVNTGLTVIGLLAVFYLIKAMLPWFLNGVWNAGSLGECRQIIAASAGEGAHGACWAMLKERWHQFIFGFYPMDQFWRPTLAFGLMFAALAPVLYSDNRRAVLTILGVVALLMILALVGLDGHASHIVLVLALMAGLAVVSWMRPVWLFWFTVLYPALAYFLLWGGSVWGVVGVMAGFAIMALVALALQERLGVVVATAAGLAAACVWWLFLQTYVTTAIAAIAPISLPFVSSDKFGGFLLAFVIGVAAISASLPIGIILALGRRSDMPLIKILSVGFIEFIRGVPLITMLFVASLLLQYFLPPQTNFDLILRVIILVTLFASAYIAEVIRGGLAALPRGQYEAADALGLDYWQAQRLIIMPQALKISIPGIVSSFIGLFKDTTLVALVGLADPLQGITKIVRADINWKGIYWEPFLFVGAIFFIFCFGMSRYSMYLERKLKTDHR
ncbi:MAG: amino acid ABC transporter permease [Paracoccaceae bacterium]